MRAVRIGYGEEWDSDFIRWTGNLLRGLRERQAVTLVRQQENPDLLLAGVWRPHLFTAVPCALVSNENWSLFPPPGPLSRYHAVLGIMPPPQPCNFISYPYAAAH